MVVCRTMPWTVTSTRGTPVAYAPVAPRVPVPVMAIVGAYDIPNSAKYSEPQDRHAYE